ncbi:MULTISPECIES: hypothetical protein [unclassified Streptomyces]|uniref:hypothetical protein n=1 Tax=unclassified Streptomyces TaxID=2593676 RepID=UPI00225A4B53|nr:MULTISPECIES: hypothetical protein [unclassified Streptomyces]MCX5052313.1 hypothetical protein [Streptomyces sp. NBC_00474]
MDNSIRSGGAARRPGRAAVPAAEGALAGAGFAERTGPAHRARAPARLLLSR